ncbi:ParB/RepB/Spo0J family partition protein [Streptomyces sp. NPDC005533]|uniref:ParB/RepB/Spo0J family partition protein n=1 Tax=Streptomyces sp. NPDC005533 TaxID=3364723 RepID=UPI0036922942
MSKKDLLGSGASFSSARRPSERSERGRAKALAQGDIPAYELVKHRLEEVSPTPLNPRRNFGSDEELTRFGEELRQAQLAACVTVSRGAYLALWPEHESAIGTAAFILINGERRYRSARHVGLESLDFVVRDDLARTREDFVDYLLAENLDREDFDVIERARGVAQLVAICAEEKEFGSKSRAAERLGKSPSWVTHQLALLELPSEIQALLSSGDMPERDGRLLARSLKDDPSLGSEGLLALLRSSKEQEARDKEEHLAIRRAAAQPVLLPAPSPGLAHVQPPTPAAEPLTAVKGTFARSTSPDKPPARNAATRDALEPPSQTVTQLMEGDQPHAAVGLHTSLASTSLHAAERAEAPGDASIHDLPVDAGKVPHVPWHDGYAVADLIFEKMDRSQRTVLLEKLLEAQSED